MKPIDLKKDKIIFIVPVMLQAYNIIVGFGRGIKLSYIPVTVCTIIMVVYFVFLWHNGKKNCI